MKNTLKILAFFLLAACSTESAPPAPGPAPTPPSASTADTRPDPDLLPGLRRPSGPRPQPPIDPRTPQQIARAACGGKCVGSMVKPLVSASGAEPILPPSWTVPAWFIDPANSATCASDTNSGTSATCTGGCSGSTCPSGIGPLVTFQELSVHRWGCLGNPTACPRLRQNTLLTFLSSQSGGTDPVYWKPSLENGANGEILCTLTTAWTGGVGTFTINAAKNRSTPQLLEATVPAGGAVGQLLINTARASHALIYKNVAGNEWLVSQPLTNLAIPFGMFSVTEVNSWATNDVVTGNTLASVNLVDLEPIVIDSNGGGTYTNGLFVSQCAGSDPPANDDTMIVNQNVTFVDDVLGRLTFVQPLTSINSVFTGVGFSNVSTVGALVVPPSGVSFSSIFLGGFVNGVGLFGSYYIDGDAILASNTTIGAPSILSQVYIETAKTISITTGAGAAIIGNGLGGPFMWGPGAIALKGTGRINYPGGATVAVADFLQTGGFSGINGQTKTCVAVPSAGTEFATCNVALSPTTLDANLGATIGCLAVGGGASVCNTTN